MVTLQNRAKSRNIKAKFLKIFGICLRDAKCLSKSTEPLTKKSECNLDINKWWWLWWLWPTNKPSTRNTLFQQLILWEMTKCRLAVLSSLELPLKQRCCKLNSSRNKLRVVGCDEMQPTCCTCTHTHTSWSCIENAQCCGLVQVTHKATELALFSSACLRLLDCSLQLATCNSPHKLP